jgi:probable phosphoglycerate mutase
MNEASTQRRALDGARRRRVYLFRHAETSYVDREGNAVPDSRLVPLTERGCEQAVEMGRWLGGVGFDRVVCSGLLRTRETAERLVAGRNIVIEERAELEEIRPGHAVLESDFDLLRDVAYAGHRAAGGDASLLGGERYAAFRDRVVTALERLIAEPDWDTLLLVCHGGTNAMILCWVLGGDLHSFGRIEQDPCCLNVIDLDVDPDTGTLLRPLLRAVNVTAHDPVKAATELTAWESIARSLLGGG